MELAALPFSVLNEREREIARWVATGAPNKEIARQLSLSEKTVKNVLTKVYEKTNTRSRTKLAVRMWRSGWQTHTVEQS